MKKLKYECDFNTSGDCLGIEDMVVRSKDGEELGVSMNPDWHELTSGNCICSACYCFETGGSIEGIVEDIIRNVAESRNE